jgi:hypothetical protein
MILLTKSEYRWFATATGAAALIFLSVGCKTSTSNQPSTPPSAVAPEMPKPPPPAASAPAAAPSAAPPPMKWSAEWTPLFDGDTLTHWAVSDFIGHGKVHVQDHQIRFELGEVMTGINWTNGPLPTNNYEISLDAMKLDGSDFFCGLTFPVSNSWCSLIVGGWGGGVVGLSSLDGADASENETTRTLYFDTNRWYHIRVQVGTDKIRAWLDNDKIIDVSIAGREVALRPGPIYISKPFGVAAYETAAALRDIKLRTIP